MAEQSIRITLTQEDILRGKLCSAGWHRVRTGKINTEVSKKGDSTNYWLAMTILAGPKTQDGASCSGVPLRKNFNEKAIGNIQGFLKACGATIDETQKSQTFNLVSCQDKEIEVFIETGLYNGKPFNEIKGWRAIQ